MYQLTIRSKAEKNFSKLPKNLQERVAKKLKLLEQDPFQIGLDVKKMAGTDKSYRLRVGEIRVIYQMDTDLKEIFVVDIDFRTTTFY